MLDSPALRWYVWTFLSLLATGMGFPIPEELPIVIAGAYVGHASQGPAPELPWPVGVPNGHGGEPDASSSPPLWWIMLPVCILGVVCGDGFLYGLGRFFGRRLLELPLMARILPPAKRAHIEENFHKYGVLVLLFARFLPTIRSPIFITAGIMRLSFTRFLLADGLYAIPGVSLLFFLAFWFGDQFSQVIELAEGKLRPLIIILVIAGIAGYLLHHFMRHPLATGDPREDVPLVGEKVADKIEHPKKPEASTVEQP